MNKRITLVTGASQGLGRAACLALAKADHHVIGLARSKKALETLDDEVRALDGSMTLIPFDLKDAAAFEPLGHAIAEKFGRIDGLLGNAGLLGTIGPLQAGG